jgi:ATP-dependent exoDNAse (exonuclease V) beta subunit
MDNRQNTLDYGSEEVFVPSSFNKVNTHPRDGYIHFFPDHHIYIFDNQRLIPVSTVISSWFTSFDAEMAAERKATHDHPKEQYIEEWACNGCRARHIGTFLHSQIEQMLLGEEPGYNSRFEYRAHYVDVCEEVSIAREMDMFRHFLDEWKPEPYRTEWRIFDEEHGLAGTIDFVARDDEGNFVMFDWKRSNKIVTDEPYGGIRKHMFNDYGRRAFGALSHLHDTPYTHYCLQQNLYRYMLRRHYDIEVERMYLVVLHSSNRTYHCVEVSPLDNEVEIILSQLEKASL